MIDDEIVTGRIAGVSHTFGSGLVSLIVALDDGGLEMIHGDSSIFRIVDDLGIGASIGIEYPDDPFAGAIIHPLEVEA